MTSGHSRASIKSSTNICVVPLGDFPTITPPQTDRHRVVTLGYSRESKVSHVPRSSSGCQAPLTPFPQKPPLLTQHSPQPEDHFHENSKEKFILLLFGNGFHLLGVTTLIKSKYLYMNIIFGFYNRFVDNLSSFLNVF